MGVGEFYKGTCDRTVSGLLDDILDAVLALKARLANSNMDSNSIEGAKSISNYSLAPTG